MNDLFAISEARQDERHYVVHLPVFDGPLDLLLHLIEKRQMEITMVSLLAVTDQYLDYLQRWEESTLPLENLAAFVSISARLLYLKSLSLLPQIPRADANNAAENAALIAQELQDHLQEYKMAREISQTLRAREQAGKQTHARSSLLAGIETQLAWTPPTLIPIEVNKLAQAFQRIIESQAHREEARQHLLPVKRVRVSERIMEIRARLGTRDSLCLSELVTPDSPRLVMVVTFLAILELWKWQRLQVEQETLMGEIVLARGPRWHEDHWEIPED